MPTIEEEFSKKYIFYGGRLVDGDALRMLEALRESAVRSNPAVPLWRLYEVIDPLYEKFLNGAGNPPQIYKAFNSVLRKNRMKPIA